MRAWVREEGVYGATLTGNELLHAFLAVLSELLTSPMLKDTIVRLVAFKPRCGRKHHCGQESYIYKARLLYFEELKLLGLVEPMLTQRRQLESIPLKEPLPRLL